MNSPFESSTASPTPNPLHSPSGETSFPGGVVPPGFLDPNRPDIDPSSTKEERRVKVSLPCLDWSIQEKNPLLQELFEEAEEQCLAIHESLAFWKEDVEESPLDAIYLDWEADELIQAATGLNAEQRAAVLASTNDLVLHALAGTGKTRSLSSMIAYVLALGTKPAKIGVSSHTVTAAQEIKTRVEPAISSLFPRINQFRGEKSYEWVQSGTIHALAYRELMRMRHPKARYSIIEETNQIKLWREACLFSLGDAFLADDEGLFLEWMRLHERIRGLAIAESRIPSILQALTRSDRLAKVADTYHKIKEARQLMDYTDLLRHWLPILLHPGYKNRWKHFFVDEYQDTSPIQKVILKVLRTHGVKVVVCGDIRQSITSFTGSDPAPEGHESILPGPTKAKELWLQVNYRCSREIIGLANAVLRQMLPPEKHKLLAHREAPPGPLIRIEDIQGKDEEYRASIREAAGLLEAVQAEGGKTVAILYRTNAQGSKLEEAIAEINNRRLKGGYPPILYSRKDYRRTALRNKTERELTAILQAWSNPTKARWFDILTSPYFPGIGEVTANTITTKGARKKPKTLEDIWAIFEGEIPRKALVQVGLFLTTWEECLPSGEDNPEMIESKTAFEALQKWVTQREAKTSDGDTVSKKEIEDSQRRSYEAAYFDKLSRLPVSTLKLALENLAALEAKEGEEEQGEAKGILLSTIHLAKGKEYDGVILHNVTWFSLPHYNALQQEEIADGILERRLRKLCTQHGSEENSLESRGIEDILSYPEKNLPRIVQYPPESLWGKHRSEASYEDAPANPPNDSIAWDWMTNPIEEERRLLYVGVTRARKHLVITTSAKTSHPFIPAKAWWDIKDDTSLIVDDEIEGDAKVEANEPPQPEEEYCPE
jgi:superfamily I DNA/RNA helicase